MVEVWTVSFVLPALGRAVYFFDNPLGTDADVVDLKMRGESLASSPIVRAWSASTHEEYRGVAGVWVTCFGSIVQLLPGFGSPNELIGLAGPAEQYDAAQFFVVPAGGVDTQCDLMVTCVN